MNQLTSAFPHPRHVILPVIHAEATDQSLRNADTAYANEADGVFLINHGMSVAALLQITGEVRKRFNNGWIGVNCLGLEPEEVFALADDTINGIWADNAFIDEERDDQEAAERILRARQQTRWRGLYFGGVAFKYQRQVGNLRRAAQIAAHYMDVVTTSGPGTGQAAPRQKIATMKAAMGDYPLAIASGITPENVSEYLDVADCFLVATGISQSFTEFEPARVKALIRAVRGRA